MNSYELAKALLGSTGPPVPPGSTVEHRNFCDSRYLISKRHYPVGMSKYAVMEIPHVHLDEIRESYYYNFSLYNRIFIMQHADMDQVEDAKKRFNDFVCGLNKTRPMMIKYMGKITTVKYEVYEYPETSVITVLLKNNTYISVDLSDLNTVGSFDTNQLYNPMHLLPQKLCQCKSSLVIQPTLISHEPSRPQSRPTESRRPTREPMWLSQLYLRRHR
jgi:hypothetical protein